MHADTYAYRVEGFYMGGKKNWCFVGHGGKYNVSLSMMGQKSDLPVSSSIDRFDLYSTTEFLSLNRGALVQVFQLGVPRNQVHSFNSQAEIDVAVKLTFNHALHETGNDSSDIY
jgi:hypothetical protein